MARKKFQHWLELPVTRAPRRPSVLSVLATARTFTLDGIAARPVRVEVDVHRGLPGFAIVGLPDAAVREARERVRAALVNCGFEFPLRRIVVNLAPASLRKAGPGMDLAIAAALLSASGQLEWEALSRVAMAGELALDGSTRPVNGALAIAEAAREEGAEAIVVPAENGAEAALAEGIDVIALDGLGRLPALVAGEWEPLRPQALPLRIAGAGGPDLADLRGQPHLRHALEVAAAGGHSLLMIGPPGAGKSLAASRLPSILPPLAAIEALEVARIASACGRLGAPLPAGRPFRAPHHTISPGAWSAAAARRAPARRPWPIAASSSSTSSASSVAIPWRPCGRRWRRARSRSPVPPAAAPCPAASCWSPRPIPVPAGAAKPIPTAAAPRSRFSATRDGSAALSPIASTSSPRCASPARPTSAAGRESPRPTCGSASPPLASGRSGASAPVAATPR